MRSLDVTVFKDHKTGRNNRWKTHLEHIVHKYTEISICEQVADRNVTELRGNLVVVNWDNANGDPVCGSDTVLQWMCTQGQNRFRTLMHSGGVLWVDVQSVKGYPVQASYDGIFGLGQIAVTSRVSTDEELMGPTVQLVSRYSDHPLLWGVTSSFTGTPSGEAQFYGVLFDRLSASEHYNEHGDALWSGWFTDWQYGWVPLLEALPSGKPFGSQVVLLAKVESDGLLIATTMRTAECSFTKITNNLTVDDFLPRVRNYHNKMLRRRTIEKTIMYIFLIGVFGSLVAGVWRNPPDSPTAQFFITVTGASVLGLATYANDWIRKWATRRF